MIFGSWKSEESDRLARVLAQYPCTRYRPELGPDLNLIWNACLQSPWVENPCWPCQARRYVAKYPDDRMEA